jgi:hypothetical protein
MFYVNIIGRKSRGFWSRSWTTLISKAWWDTINMLQNYEHVCSGSQDWAWPQGAITGPRWNWIRNERKDVVVVAVSNEIRNYGPNGLNACYRSRGRRFGTSKEEVHWSARPEEATPQRTKAPVQVSVGFQETWHLGYQSTVFTRFSQTTVMKSGIVLSVLGCRCVSGTETLISRSVLNYTSRHTLAITAGIFSLSCWDCHKPVVHIFCLLW